jgi:uncharacterized delta-60 repeat protein
MVRSRTRGAARQGVLYAAAFLALAVVPAASGQAGGLDPTFSGDGKRALEFAPHGFAALRDVAIQSDGKIVGAGTRRGNFAVLRFLSNGSLDTSFGGDGKVVTQFSKDSGASAVAVQADGRIVVAGTFNFDGGRHLGWFQLVRYLPGGQLDSSFGGGDGIVRAEFSRFLDRCNAIAIQPDGKIVAAGERSLAFTGGDFAVMRFNADGKLDTSFDGDGKQAIDFSSGLSEELPDEAQRVVVQPDGKIVVGGTALHGPPGFQRGFALARLNMDGSLDSSFGSGGTVLSTLPSSDSEAWGLALGSDGKLVLAGGVVGRRFALTRFDSDGALDPTFGGDGLVTTRFPGEFDANAWDVEVQPDGRTVAVGEAGIDFAVARYNVDGILDSSFGSDGRVTTSFNPRFGAETAFGMVLQSDGKIVAAGDAFDARPSRLLLARYLGS